MKSGENVKVLLVKNDFDDPEILLEMFKSLFKNMKSKEENGYIAICFTYDNNLDIIHAYSITHTPTIAFFKKDIRTPTRFNGGKYYEALKYFIRVNDCILT